MAVQHLSLIGPQGNIEAALHLPKLDAVPRVAIVCHPHPLQDGTMNNKVVVTVAKTFAEHNIPCVRFNYRGVGKSAGMYGDVKGEVEDCLAVVAWVAERLPHAELYLAGFSFGAYVAAEVASKVATKQLITIAPSVERMPYFDLPRITCPWLVIQGEDDEVVTPAAVYAWYDQLVADKTLVKFPETGHFFHGKLIALQEVIAKILA